MPWGAKEGKAEISSSNIHVVSTQSIMGRKKGFVVRSLVSTTLASVLRHSSVPGEPCTSWPLHPPCHGAMSPWHPPRSSQRNPNSWAVWGGDVPLCLSWITAGTVACVCSVQLLRLTDVSLREAPSARLHLRGLGRIEHCWNSSLANFKHSLL